MEKLTEKEFEEILNAALGSFWDIVLLRFPRQRGNDIGMHRTVAMRTYCEVALREWLETNVYNQVEATKAKMWQNFIRVTPAKLLELVKTNPNLQSASEQFCGDATDIPEGTFVWIDSETGWHFSESPEGVFYGVSSNQHHETASAGAMMNWLREQYFE